MTTPDMTDELVEKVARALHDAWCGDPDGNIFDHTVDLRWQEWLPYARAVLAIARPAILEEAWQPIETAPKDGSTFLGYQWSDYRQAGSFHFVAWDDTFKTFVDDFTDPFDYEISCWRPLLELAAIRSLLGASK